MCVRLASLVWRLVLIRAEGPRVALTSMPALGCVSRRTPRVPKSFVVLTESTTSSPPKTPWSWRRWAKLRQLRTSGQRTRARSYGTRISRRLRSAPPWPAAREACGGYGRALPLSSVAVKCLPGILARDRLLQAPSAPTAGWSLITWSKFAPNSQSAASVRSLMAKASMHSPARCFVWRKVMMSLSVFLDAWKCVCKFLFTSSTFVSFAANAWQMRSMPSPARFYVASLSASSSIFAATQKLENFLYQFLQLA